MTAMTADCCLYYCGPGRSLADFRRVLLGLVLRSDTQYSLRHALVAVRADQPVADGSAVTAAAAAEQVIGVSVSYDGAQLHALRAPFLEAASREWDRDLSGIADETSAGELYLDSLAVEPAWRGRGVASALLHATKRKADALGLPLGLLVDCDNAAGAALYRKVGFRCVGSNEWGGHPMRHLQW